MSEEESQATEAEQATAAHEQGDNSSQGESEAPDEWFWAEGVPGQGPRPDFLPEKFSSVADAAKARGQLEKKLGAFTGAPEEYDFEELGLDKEQHTLKELSALGKELNMSQDGFEKLVTKLMGAQDAESEVDMEAEVSKLGEEGERLMLQYKNFSDNHLMAEEKEQVKSWIKSAEDLKVFTAMVKGIYGKRLPTDNTMYMGNHGDSEAQVRSDIAKNLDRYRNDKVFQKDIRNRLDRLQQIADRG